MNDKASRKQSPGSLLVRAFADTENVKTKGRPQKAWWTEVENQTTKPTSPTSTARAEEWRQRSRGNVSAAKTVPAHEWAKTFVDAAGQRVGPGGYDPNNFDEKKMTGRQQTPGGCDGFGNCEKTTRNNAKSEKEYKEQCKVQQERLRSGCWVPEAGFPDDGGRRAGTEIPGYQGYIGGCSENVVGLNRRRANDHQAVQIQLSAKKDNSRRERYAQRDEQKKGIGR